MLDKIRADKLNGEGFGYSFDLNVYDTLTAYVDKSILASWVESPISNFDDLIRSLESGHLMYGKLEKTFVGAHPAISFFDSGYFLTQNFVIEKIPRLLRSHFISRMCRLIQLNKNFSQVLTLQINSII